MTPELIEGLGLSGQALSFAERAALNETAGLRAI